MNHKLLLGALISITFFSACSERMPTCSDQAVKDLALGLTKNQIKNALAVDPSILLPLLPQLNKDDPIDQKILTGALQGQVNFDLLKTSTNPSAMQIVKSIEEMANDVKLEATRIASSDEKLKKITCDTDVLMQGNKGELKYSAQVTDDKKVRVELIDFQ